MFGIRGKKITRGRPEFEAVHVYIVTPLLLAYTMSLRVHVQCSCDIILINFHLFFQTEDSHQRLLSSGSSNTEREAKETSSESRECFIIH